MLGGFAQERPLSGCLGSARLSSHARITCTICRRTDFRIRPVFGDGFGNPSYRCNQLILTRILIVVPEPEADLLLEHVVKLVLIAHAVEVLHSDAGEVPRAAAPLPAGLHGQVAAEVVFLTEMGIDGEEGRAADSARLRGL